MFPRKGQSKEVPGKRENAIDLEAYVPDVRDDQEANVVKRVAHEVETEISSDKITRINSWNRLNS